MINITIRLAVSADAGNMAEIHALSWETAYKDIIPMEYIKKKNDTRPELFKRIITEENTTHYVIQTDGKTVGILCVAPPQTETNDIISDRGIDNSFYELHYIYLHPDYYRKGIGTQAMKFVLDKARNAGKSNMILWVFAENLNSINFYKKCGFTADGATKTHNYGKEMKCIRMRREI